MQPGPASPPPPPPPPEFTQARADDWDRLRAEFLQVRLDQVVPLGAWLRDQPWKLLWVRWFLVYALVPFALATGAETLGMESAAWGFGVYFALTWLIVLTLCMRPERVDYTLLGLVALFTVVIGITLVLFGQQLPLISQLYGAAQSDVVPVRLFGFVLGVGLMEEACKALPLLLFVYRKPHGYRPLTFAYIGVVSGVAFGVKEAVVYSHAYAAALQQMGIQALGGYVAVQILRLIGLPLLHGCWSGIAGYFIGLAHFHGAAPRALIVTGIALAAILHGCYNTFAGGWLGLGMAGLTLLIFLSYVRSGDLISQQLLEAGTPTSSAEAPAAASPPT
jgi:RsiW-degrading membrane proteinase PrsW (M82 family)